MRLKLQNEMEAIRALARALDPDPEHAFQVSRLALELFEQLESLHGLPPTARRLLEAAALLHDTGFSAEMRGHHKHSLDIIRSAELPGFSRRERDIVACVARYHRKAEPSPDHPVFRDLDEQGRAVVTRLAALLRIADGLDRAHQASVREVRVRQRDECVEITVLQNHPSPADLEGAARKQGLFESVFQTQVKVAGKIKKGAPG